MQLTVISSCGNDLTVQGVTIPGAGPGYQIPTSDLITWCGDLTFNMYIGNNNLQIQDDQPTSLPVGSALSVLAGIHAGTITTS